MMKKWLVRFKENGDEYQGSLLIHATRVYLVEGEDRVIMADGIRIEIDEPVIDIEEV